MTRITHKPLFWILFCLGALASGYLVINYFSSAFPIVNLEIKMNRGQALHSAAKLAQQFNVGPSDYAQAASFESDQAVQTFVELEAGGKAAFSQMIKDPYYTPYTWRVRHFKEFEKNETLFIFKPDGTAYGFIETLSDNTQGATLTSEQAQAIAQQAAQNWHITLADYILVEASKETRASGRIDHTYTYERPNIRIGNGYYRLKLVVSGDKLTEVSHSIKIPEEFSLKYKEMRSANNGIAFAATIAMILLYFLGGCVIGLFFLLRRRFVIWRPAIIWGVLIAALHVLTTINQLPMAWMNYNTTLATHVFLMQQLIGMIIQFIFMSIFYSLTFAAAEGLTRAAFADHPRLWQLWSRSSAGSIEILGRTLGGYFMVAFYFAFIVLFYLVTTTFFGWWTPSDALSDPNILATYFPWLSSIVYSLGAGFWEECLFRAIPIAGAALIGKRLGRERLWIIIGFIVQALIFGAAHANYPAQPAYARLIELIYFSVVNGLVYMWFGLLPAIIAHFTYDVVWFSLPLFVSTAPGAWFNQVMVILLTLIPLGIVLFRRLQNSTWHALSADNYNGTWAPEPQTTVHTEPPLTTPRPMRISNRTQYGLLTCGVLGLILWLTTTHFKQDAKPLTISRDQAQTIATDHLKKMNVPLEHPWQAISTVQANYTCPMDTQLQHEFVWQYDHQAYRALLGTYLTQPRWIVRTVRFAGSTQERAEEYTIVVTQPDSIYRLLHKLPEEMPGASLEEEQARVIAHRRVQQQFAIDPTTLKEISAVALKHPNRKDWTFTFFNPADFAHNDGQARLVVQLGGDKVIDTYRYIHVPESWERTSRNNKNLYYIFMIFCMLILAALLCFALFTALRNWQPESFNIALISACVLFVLYIISVANTWPVIIATFNTYEPYSNQLLTQLGIMLITGLFKIGLLSMLIATLAGNVKFAHAYNPLRSTIWGISAGLFVAGILSMLEKLKPALEPLWANYNALPFYMPLINVLTSSIMAYIIFVCLIMLVFIALDHITTYGQRNTAISIIFCLLAGICLQGAQEIIDVPFWLMSGMVIGMIICALYYVLGRYTNTFIPSMAGTILILQLAQQAAFDAYPMAVISNILICCIIALLVIVCTKKIKVTHA